MPKTCNAEGCSNRVWGKGYCARHQYLRTDKKPKSPKPFTDKRMELNKAYYAESRQFIKENPDCVIKSPNCKKVAQAVNHKKGRGKHLMDKSKWEASCNPCNQYCEDNTQWAIDNGHKERRHTI